MDVELNAAIHTLFEKHVPRGFEIVKPALGLSDPAQEQERRRKEGGLPLVAECTDPTESLFGDCEIEHEYRALMTTAFGNETVREGHDHPGVCIGIMAAACCHVGQQIVDQYGDDDRTLRWRKLLTAYLLGGYGVALAGKEGQTPASAAPEMVAEDTFGLTFAEFVTGMTAFAQYAEFASQVAELGVLVPTDERQNAPTTATRQ